MTYRQDLRRPKLSVVLDPRFSGGTSAAVAREILALSPHVELQLFALETRMFKGRDVNPKLQLVLDELGLGLVWNPKVIRDEFVAIHNPSCLKFDQCLDLKIICDTAYVVTHENFTRPHGGDGFDVSLCLDLLDQALLCRRQVLAPVSAYNNGNVLDWMKLQLSPESRWRLADFHWFNICDFVVQTPVTKPLDRRGRLSRAGFEKFPDLETMYRHFPEHAKRCAILGGDTFLLDPAQIPDHWEVYPFGAMAVEEFLEGIDFFIYFTHPLYQESFGRVIAEAIAAGKVVVTDPKTARTFGNAVVASDGDDVDEIISELLADPEGYRDFVMRSQHEMTRFSAKAFVNQTLSVFRTAKEYAHDLF